jgi:hypothetical protein
MAPADIDRAFGDGSLFAYSAYRLEQLPEYDSPQTREDIRLWQAGQPQGQDLRAYWDQVVGTALSGGKTMQRVHLVEEPLSVYLSFELDWYRGSVDAGEDIRVLPADKAAGLDLPGFDYWLFDAGTPQASVAVMYYGDRGAWLRTEITTDPAFAARCATWRDAALSRALTLHDYNTDRSAA